MIHLVLDKLYFFIGQIIFRFVLDEFFAVRTDRRALVVLRLYKVLEIRLFPIPLFVGRQIGRVGLILICQPYDRKLFVGVLINDDYPTVRL